MTWKTILVPHDFSASANHAAAIARDEARAHGGTIVLLHVIDLPYQLGPDAVIVPEETGAPISDKQDGQSSPEAHLPDIAERPAKDGGTATGVVVIGSPVDEINRAIDAQHADLVGMGTQGGAGIGPAVARGVAGA